MIWWLAGLAMAGTLEGTVTDLQGNPLSGVYLAPYDIAGRQGDAVGPTLTDGRFAVPVEPGRYRLRVVPGMAVNRVETWFPGDTTDYCQATVFEVQGDESIEDQVALAPGVAVAGRLVDGAGEIAVGARVEGRPVIGSAGIQTRTGVSGTDGRFELRGLLPDKSWIVRVQSDDHPSQWFPGDMSPLQGRQSSGDEGALVDLGDADLLLGISVGGQISGPDGPLGRAVTSVFSDGQIRTVRADEGGDYRVFGLPTGDITAWADAPGHSRAYWPDSPIPGDRLTVPNEGGFVEDFDVEVPFEAVVSGQLIGDGDLTGASVLLLHESRTVGLGSGVDSAGNFEITEVPPGTWNVSVSGEEQGLVDGLVRGEAGPMAWTVQAGERIDIEVEPERGVRFRGVVLQEDGSPAYDALVTVRSRLTDRRYSTRTAKDGSWFLAGFEGGDTWDLLAEGDPLCPSDLDRVRIYYPGTPDPEARIGLGLAGGDLVEWEVTIPDDADRDGMADTWERENGLEVGPRESDEDPDGDGQVNVIEYWEDTDPLSAPGRGCGCVSAGGVAPAWALGLAAMVAGLRRRRR